MSTSPTSLVIGSGEAWTPFVQIYDLFQRTVEDSNSEQLEALDTLLTQYQSNFQRLVSTSNKSEADRESVKKGATICPNLDGLEPNTLLPSAWVVESILLSDVLDINEFEALDLLATGDAESMNFPCWSRGLIAVAMYFEGQTALVSTLHLMLRISPGLTWGSRVSPRLLELIKPFINKIVNYNPFDRILELLTKFDRKRILELLDSNLALGDWRHRTEICKYLTSIRVELAQIIFCISAQNISSWNSTLRILEYLRHVDAKGDENLGKEEVLLITAVLFALENNLSTESLNRDYLTDFRRYLNEAEAGNYFKTPELLEIVRLGYHTGIYKFLSETTLNSLGDSTQMETVADLLGEDELELPATFWSFLSAQVFRNEFVKLNEEEHVMRKFHSLFTDLVSHVPMKIKELKSRSEEVARSVLMYQEQGISANFLSTPYHAFLEALADFYAQDKELALAQDYFTTETQNVSLAKFIRSLCFDTSTWYVCNARAMSGFCASYPTGTFSLLKQGGHNLSLDHFFDSLSKVIGSFETPPLQPGSVFESESYHRVVYDSFRSALSPHETNGILSYLRLITTLGATDSGVRRFFSETKKHWVQLLFSAVRLRSLPREIRAEGLEALAALIPTEESGMSGESIANYWDMFYSAKLVEREGGDLKDELIEKESRLHSYSLCIGFLKLFNGLAKGRYVAGKELGYDELVSDGPETGEKDVLNPYVMYVRDTVLIKLRYRSYKDSRELWEKMRLSISIIAHLLDIVPALMINMLSDSHLLATVFSCLIDCSKVREMSTGEIKDVDSASLEILNLIHQVIIRQDRFMNRKSNTLVKDSVLLGMQHLLININSNTKSAEILLTLLKFIDKFNPEEHRNLSLEIITTIVSQHAEVIDIHLYNGISSNFRMARILECSLSDCLSNPNSSPEIKAKIMKLIRSSVVNPAPNLAFYLLGVDKKIEFKNPDPVSGYKTILHTVLENASSIPDVFLTLSTLLKDERLQSHLLHYLRVTQFLVKYYTEALEMRDGASQLDYSTVAQFLKCVSIELKGSRTTGPLAHSLLGERSNKFIGILDRIPLQPPSGELPLLEFFEEKVVLETIASCEYYDKDLKIKLVDMTRLQEIFDDQINRLERNTALRLKKSVMGEAKELVSYVEGLNRYRRRESSKILLFECWKEVLELLILSPQTLKLVGVDFLTSNIRLISDKVLSSGEEASSEAFERLAAETVLSLSGALPKFGNEVSESMLNLLLSLLCSWVSRGSSGRVRSLLYPSLLHLLLLMKEGRKSVTSRSNFATIIDNLTKDALNSDDVGKLTSLHLLSEIIQWSMSSGFGGRVPPPSSSSSSSSSTHLGTHLYMAHPYSPSLSSLPPPSPAPSLHGTLGGGGGGGDDGSFSTSMRLKRGDSSSSLLSTPKSRRVEQGGGDSSVRSTLASSHSLLSSKRSLIGEGGAEAPSFLNYQRVGGGGEMELDEKNLTFATRATVMNYMHSRGITRHLIESLPLEDDRNLRYLFGEEWRSTIRALRGLYVFMAKMSLFVRFGQSGPEAVGILLDGNLVERLSDMSCFGLIGRLLGEWELGEKSGELEGVYIAILLLFHSLHAAQPKNALLSSQIYEFFKKNSSFFLNLLTLDDLESSSEVDEATLLFTSLLARLASRESENEFDVHDEIFIRLISILRHLINASGFNKSEIELSWTIVQFLYGIGSRRESGEKGLVLSSVFRGERGGNETELSIGSLLLLIERSGEKLLDGELEGDKESNEMLHSIIEMGLTLAYRHISTYSRKYLGQTSLSQFQQSLRLTVEDSLLPIVSEALEDHPSQDFVQTLLMRIRHFANVTKDKN